MYSLVTLISPVLYTFKLILIGLIIPNRCIHKVS